MKQLLLILLIAGCAKTKVETPVIPPAPLPSPIKKEITQKPMPRPEVTEVYESLSSQFRKTEL